MKIKRLPYLALSIVCAVGLARSARAQGSYPWCSTATTHHFTFAGVLYNFGQSPGCRLINFNPKILGSPSGLATIPSSPAGSPGIPTTLNGPGIDFSSNVTGASGAPVPWWVHIPGFTYGNKVTYSASFPDQTPYCYDNQSDFCGNDQYMQLTAMGGGTYYPAFGGAGTILFKGIASNSHHTFGSGEGRSTDIDADGDTDEADENAMRTAIANPPGASKFDLNFMGGATNADLQILLEEANRRWPGTNNRYLRGSCKTAPAGGLPPCNNGEGEASFWMGNYDPADLYEVAPATPSVSASGNCTTNLVSWADTGDDSTTGQAKTYELRRSTIAITTDSVWSSAAVVTVGTPVTCPPTLTQFKMRVSAVGC